MKIMVKGMLGAGNLGDDLISYFLITHIKNEYPKAELFVYSGEQSNPFVNTDKSSNIQVLYNSTNFPSIRNMKLKIREATLKREVNKVVIGGGGLIQDVHQISTINKWLNSISTKTDNYLVGMGVGPIMKDVNKSFLRNTLKYFNIQVRDLESSKLIKEIGYTSSISSDIVAGSDITKLFNKTPYNNQSNTLGIAIRPWKKLNKKEIEKLINYTVKEKNIKKISLFTFEYSENNISEYEFNLELKKLLKSKTLTIEMITYNKDDWRVFKKAFEEVDFAIASRLHANILWQKLNIPVIPISYDDKVNSFYKNRTINDIRENRYSENEFIYQENTEEYTLPNLNLKTNKPSMIRRWYLISQNVKFYFYDIYNSISIRLKK